MRISYSAIDTFRTCPLKYKFQEIDKIKVQKSKEAVFGTAVHQSLKFLFSRDPLYPTLDEVLNFFGNYWQNAKNKAGWADEREEKIYFEDGLKILKNFYAKNQPWNFNVLDLETRFETELRDQNTGQTHVLAGVIDRVDKIEPDGYEIIDYKTARRMSSQANIDSNLQLGIYHLGFIKRWPELGKKDIRLSLYFLKHGEKISTKKNDNSLEETKRKILSKIGEIQECEKNNDFIPNPSALCDWCGYKPLCPAWRHIYQTDKNPLKEEEIKNMIKEYLELKEQNRENDLKVKKIQSTLASYMSENNLTRVFGDEGYASKTVKISLTHDCAKIKSILEPLGMWADVLKLDEKKLASLLPILSAEHRQQIKAVSVNKISEIISVSRKKFNPPTN